MAQDGTIEPSCAGRLPRKSGSEQRRIQRRGLLNEDAGHCFGQYVVRRSQQFHELFLARLPRQPADDLSYAVHHIALLVALGVRQHLEQDRHILFRRA